MTRVIAGIAIWIAAAVAACYAAFSLDEQARSRGVETLRSALGFGVRGPARVEIRFDVPTALEPGDGVYRRDGVRFRRIGQIERAGADGRSLLAVLDPVELDTTAPSAVALAFETDGSLLWVYETLLPEPVRQRIVAEWRAVREAHEQRFLDEFTPLLREVSRETARIVGDELQQSLRDRNDEVKALAAEYGRSLLQDTLLPLLIEEVWPIARAHGEEPVRDVGRELWDAAPLFGFAWRGIYDRIPLTGSSLIEERWREYLRDDAIPILREHRPALEAAAADILRDVLVNERVRAETTGALVDILSDARVRSLVVDLATDVKDSERLREYLASVAADPRVRRLSGWVGDELDALYRKIGNLIVLDQTGERISPHFSRFLRTLVLKKDRRFVLLEEDGRLAGGPAPEGVWLPEDRS